LLAGENPGSLKGPLALGHRLFVFPEPSLGFDLKDLNKQAQRIS